MGYNSDLDLAIYTQSESFSARKLDILHDLARFGFCKVDLVFLDQADIILQYEAVRQNMVVYHTESFNRGTTYSNIVRKYLDFLPYLEVQRKAYKKRILDGKT
ncbi:MAG TPA: nucleotidyltransferase domain-containing protein [Thermodesulfovibrionia bacterium]|nr:nucleotidyltransferase domain-containing protein [Thermodesulfovibrionia bacterium]